MPMAVDTCKLMRDLLPNPGETWGGSQAWWPPQQVECNTISVEKNLQGLKSRAWPPKVLQSLWVLYECSSTGLLRYEFKPFAAPSYRFPKGSTEFSGGGRSPDWSFEDRLLSGSFKRGWCRQCRCSLARSKISNFFGQIAVVVCSSTKEKGRKEEK